MIVCDEGEFGQTIRHEEMGFCKTDATRDQYSIQINSGCHEVHKNCEDDSSLERAERRVF